MLAAGVFVIGFTSLSVGGIGMKTVEKYTGPGGGGRGGGGGIGGGSGISFC